MFVFKFPTYWKRKTWKVSNFVFKIVEFWVQIFLSQSYISIQTSNQPNLVSLIRRVFLNFLLRLSSFSSLSNSHDNAKTKHHWHTLKPVRDLQPQKKITTVTMPVMQGHFAERTDLAETEERLAALWLCPWANKALNFHEFWKFSLARMLEFNQFSTFQNMA